MKIISCMKIDEEILRSFGAETKTYQKKEIIFKEEESPLYYYQIISGKVKENNYDEDGKEFIQNILGDGQSFGDFSMFIQKKYPINAVCLEPCIILKLPRKNFAELLRIHPSISVQMNACLSQRLYYKVIMMKSLASQNPAKRLYGLMEYLKSFQDCEDSFSFPVELTRQQIADLTGLRVETVIRTIKKMANDNLLQIINRRILY
ncbi:Crp/Fnr family transcriptional regulator [Chryseobacterium sp. GMJ5]|uniref:Crp/Fnr family transcriptional regulator n=1 Tax=Chryseobacterium gilvum TaxID=2976534 RepID=A0ABT2VX66_9FLAO|nr:Crp/Fnr family transcriptional regulator [Chryseobacterium gilvum]MCU7613699.1 Crp/Fnr family transcriptional regulator [Chryseobacterium gilvum]